MRVRRPRGSFGRRRREIGGPDSGSAVIIALMFTFVFLLMGLALYYLVISSIRGTELESREVKAFNVAEAGLDAGMLTLSQGWPRSAGEPASLDGTQIRADFDPNEFRDPSRSPADEFITVEFHDNTSSIYDGSAPDYDSNGDGLMYISSEANVDDDRHRIIILAKRHTYNLDFPLIALYTNAFDANAQGLDVFVDPTQTEPLPLNVAGQPAVPAFHNGQIGKRGLNTGPSVAENPSDPGDFESWIGNAKMGMLKTIAQGQNTYFTDPVLANDFLLSADGAGSVVYLETTAAVEIGGNVPIGSRTKPVVLAIDANGQDVGLDFRGTADFFGIVVVKGNPIIRGTSSIFGSFISSGTMINNGNGSLPEIQYNGDIIKLINRLFTISVNIVPNTWEEYTTPRDTGS
jgi:Tfp pilus assembly protein PilX